jgi:hypothetical protein
MLRMKGLRTSEAFSDHIAMTKNSRGLLVDMCACVACRSGPKRSH